MTREVIITIRVPDDVTVQVHERPGPSSPGVEGAGQPSPPASDEPPHSAVREAERVYAEDLESWPAGRCPVHGYEWKDRGHGPFCSAKAKPGEPADKKGYCAVKPGAVYQGRRAA